MDAGRPGFFAFGVVQFLGEIELRDLVDHSAVLQRGCHVRTLLCRGGSLRLRGWMPCG
jgi:hypothetical protein